MRPASSFLHTSILAVGVALGQEPQTEVTQVTGALSEFQDHFGRAVALYGDTAIVSEPISSVHELTAGAVQVFERVGERWVWVDQLAPPVIRRGDNIGRSLAMFRNTAVVGAPRESDIGYLAGNVHVFERSTTGWTYVQDLAFPGLLTKDAFGSAVGIWGKTIAVGARGDDTLGSSRGAVYVFEAGPVGSWTLAAKLLTSDPAGGWTLGQAVDVHENTIVAGSADTAYIYTRSASGWQLETRLVRPADVESDDFGEAVAIWGDTIAVADPVEYSAWGYRPGRVFLFERVAYGQWDLVQVLQASDPFNDGQGNGRFGESLDLYEDKLLVGSPRWGPSDPEAETGKAYLFERDEHGTWHETRQFSASDAAPSRFSNAVALSDQAALVGADAADVDDISAGKAYFFDLDQAATYRPGEPNSTGTAATLHAYGSRSAAASRLTLRAEQLPPQRPVLFLVSSAPAHHPHPGGSAGHLWLADPRTRFPQVVTSSDLGSASLEVDVTALPFDPPVHVQPGETWYFQAWYGDADPLPTSNLTAATALKFE